MREKIARALLRADYPDDAGGEMEEFWWARHGGDYLMKVDAVLDALMEPTKEVLSDGLIAIEDNMDSERDSYGSHDYATEATAYHCFRAMIQAAREGK